MYNYKKYFQVLFPHSLTFLRGIFCKIKKKKISISINTSFPFTLLILYLFVFINLQLPPGHPQKWQVAQGKAARA